MTTQYIDATPTWENITTSLLLVYESAKKPSDKNWARDEILKMAQLADKHVEHTKKMFKSINIIWSVEDVIQRAKQENINLTETQALEILEDAKDNHDATIGINWDVLDYHIEDVANRQKG